MTSFLSISNSLTIAFPPTISENITNMYNCWFLFLFIFVLLQFTDFLLGVFYHCRCCLAVFFPPSFSCSKAINSIFKWFHHKVLTYISFLCFSSYIKIAKVIFLHFKNLNDKLIWWNITDVHKNNFHHSYFFCVYT